MIGGLARKLEAQNETVSATRPRLPVSARIGHLRSVPLGNPSEMDAFARSRPWARRVARDRLFGLDLVHATMDEASRELVAAAQNGERLTLQFVNAHCVNMLHASPAYRRAMAKADLLFPDGSGMRLAGRLAGTELGDNLNGTDLFPALCEKAAAAGEAIYLLGGRPDVAKLAGAAMAARFPGLRIAGTHDGYWAAHEEDALIEQINASGASIVLVGLGVPLQETWIDKVRDRLDAAVVAGVGGLFDYYSGMVQRAPLAFRKAGCEWVWRLMLEPRRLFARYVLGNPLFVLAALFNAWYQHPLGQLRSRAVKRGFDMAATMAGLILALPIFLLVALAIKLEDGGSVFFAQHRIGRDGKPFRMWKFRSMVPDAEALQRTMGAGNDRDDVCFKLRQDPRVTRVGRIMRRLSIDELPQLFNILSGDMSIVGPRPALPREVLAYDERSRMRLSGKPGLTCTWQVSGRANLSFDEQVDLDIAYLDGRSFHRDIALIMRTIPAVLTARGAY